MFPKVALTFLVVGVLSVNALTLPVARSPAPEPESQELEAWMLKRDLSYELFSRELEDWAEWAKREPSPGQAIGKIADKVTAKVAGKDYKPAGYIPPAPASNSYSGGVTGITGPQKTGVKYAGPRPGQ